MSIKAVLFDLGGTLEDISSTPQERRTAAEYIRKVLLTRSEAFDIPSEVFFEKLMNGYENYKKYTSQTLLEKSPEEIWGDYYLADFEEEKEIIKRMADHLTEIWETMFYVRDVKPETKATLQALKTKGYKLGLITNTTSRSAPYLLLEKYGILDYFDVILTSAGEGLRKPGAEPFKIAADFLGLDCSECMYVGDQVKKDMQGSCAAGYGSNLLIASVFTKILPEDEKLINGRIESIDRILDKLDGSAKD